MNNYEGIFILKPALKEDEAKNIFKTIADSVVKNGGNVKKEEVWGKKQLAFTIKKVKEGHYYKLDFSAPSAAITKLEAAYKLNSDIVRLMITKR